MKMVLIVNPVAGAGRCGRVWPRIQRAIGDAGVTYDLKVTQKPGDATGLAAEALRKGATTVVAVGGDGTANEVANGFFYPDGAVDTPINPAATLGYVALGTGRDFARALALPADPIDATLSVLGANARVHTIDVGRAQYVGAGDRLTRRYFLTGADLGLGAEVAKRVERSGRWLKRGGGFVAYLLGGIGAILSHRPTSVSIQLDGAPASTVQANVVFVANGPFTGGGMRMAPGASIEDGLFDVLIAHDETRTTLLLQLLPAIYRGAHLGHPSVEHHRVRRVRIEPAIPLLFQMDGEQVGRGPVDMTVVPKALRVLVARQ
jgi:YegS/Rv2252/BmrU family lipid kinase